MKLKGVVSTAIAISSGVLVLAGYFIETKLLLSLRAALLNWAIILAGFAILVGIANLFIVHTNKVRRKQKGSAYSFILVIALIATLVVGFLPAQMRNIGMPYIFKTIQRPVEASLMALLAVTLTYASIRLLRRRLSLLSVVFLVTAVLILLGTAPLPFLGDVPVLSDWVRPFIAQVFAAGGARGILIGVALGTLTTGLRVLFGTDRPYGGK